MTRSTSVDDRERQRETRRKVYRCWGALANTAGLPSVGSTTNRAFKVNGAGTKSGWRIRGGRLRCRSCCPARFCLVPSPASVAFRICRPTSRPSSAYYRARPCRLCQIDLARFDATAEPRIDLSHQAFVSLRTFLRVATGHRGAVKWQLTGPLTIGMALLHFGVPVADAFHVALRVVRATARAIHAQVAQDLPGCTQVVFIDEPSAGAVLTPGFPLSPDDAIDLVSGSMAVLEDDAVMGLHCCAHADLAALLAAGPAIVSVPAEATVALLSGYLAPFLDGGGIVAWGVVPTDRPLALNADRYWHELSSLWSELVVGGCDPGRLRRQSIITPACGLAMHTPEQAAHVFALTNAVACHVAEQAAATRLTVRA
jgi:hypothetical protein